MTRFALRLAALAIGLAIALVWMLRGDGDKQNKPAPPVAQPAAPVAKPEPAKSEPAKHVRKVTPEDRRRLAEEIAAARARARTAAPSPSPSSGSSPSSGTTAPALPDDDEIPLEQVADDVKTALTEAIPILAECYDQVYGPDAGLRSAVVQMEMTSDPDVGTIIDGTEMNDEAGQKLDPKLDDCLRTTIESLEVPPFSRGGKVRVQYSFKFD